MAAPPDISGHSASGASLMRIWDQHVANGEPVAALVATGHD
jgi:hypothetical protein